MKQDTAHCSASGNPITAVFNSDHYRQLQEIYAGKARQQEDLRRGME